MPAPTALTRAVCRLCFAGRTRTVATSILVMPPTVRIEAAGESLSSLGRTVGPTLSIRPGCRRRARRTGTGGLSGPRTSVTMRTGLRTGHALSADPGGHPLRDPRLVVGLEREVGALTMRLSGLTAMFRICLWAIESRNKSSGIRGLVYKGGSA